jgi:metacaspase-1
VWTQTKLNKKINMNVLLSFVINDYPGEQNDLQGCVNDQINFSNKLDSEGFKFEKRLFKNSQCTLSLVKSEVEKVVNELKQGDVLIIQHSHHGTQVVDIHNDESDGYDEALCMYDGDLIDDEYNTMLSKLKDGVVCFILLDSCFSGTATKSGKLTRFSRFRKPREEVRFIVNQKLLRTEDQKWIVLSACGENETSDDSFTGSSWNGAATYYAMLTLKKDMTYNEWYRKIRTYLPNKKNHQTPELSGNSNLLSLPVFSPMAKKVNCFQKILRKFKIIN